MTKRLTDQNKSVRLNNLRRNKQVNIHTVDLSDIFVTPASKQRLEIFTRFRRIELDEESYNSELDKLPKIERVKMMASLLIITSGDKELLNINELARRIGLTRASIHAAFGEKNREPAVTAIYRSILSEFTQIVMRRFEDLFEYFRREPPMELLDRLYLAIFSAVREKPEYALVSMQEISLANQEERRIVAPAFDKAAKLIRDAREEYFNEDAKKLKDYHILHLLFYTVRGVILEFFGEGIPPDEKDFLSEKAAYDHVLMYLKLFASEDASKLIDKRKSENEE